MTCIQSDFWVRNCFGTYLNGTVEEAVVLTRTVEQSLGVSQLVGLARRRAEKVHREVLHHRTRHVGRCQVGWKRGSDCHLGVCLSYHVVITARSLLLSNGDHRSHLWSKRSGCGLKINSSERKTNDRVRSLTKQRHENKPRLKLVAAEPEPLRSSSSSSHVSPMLLRVSFAASSTSSLSTTAFTAKPATKIDSRLIGEH